jgi:hypothetical protein
LDRPAEDLALDAYLAALEGYMKACSFDGCGRPHSAKGFCGTHYRQMQRTGQVRAILPPVEEPTVRLAGLRITRFAADALTRRGPSLYAAAKATLEESVR